MTLKKSHHDLDQESQPNLDFVSKHLLTYYHYQDLDFYFELYEERCKQLDEAGHNLLFGESDEEEVVEEGETEEDNKMIKKLMMKQMTKH